MRRRQICLYELDVAFKNLFILVVPKSNKKRRIMAYDFVVIGATGLQGRIVSRDLLEHGYSVLLCGRKRKRVEHLLTHDHRSAYHHVELTEKKHTAMIVKQSKAPIVINCAEGDFNLELQKLCLRLGKHYLDLGSDPEMTSAQFRLHKQFQQKGLTALTGCGSVPGIGNVMLRYAAEKLDTVSAVDAGFAWIANQEVFVVPFSIMSIMEELTDRPTVVEDGGLKKVAPQSDKQEMTFKEVGKQECFLVRHAEAYTFYHYLKDKGVKNVRFYAGFPEFSYKAIMELIQIGLNSKAPGTTGERPVDLLTEALKNLPIPSNYRETENLWVTLTGKKDNEAKTIAMSCIVPTIPGWEEHGCNIDTGLPCSIMAMMIKEGMITERGSRSPEYFVPVEPFFKELAKRRMKVYENGKEVN